MPDTILLLNTATEQGWVALASQEACLFALSNDVPAMHASFLQPAIQQALEHTGTPPQQIAAVAVLNGPGSYTGLRVGLSAAKGLCYAWDIPLLTISTLQAMALAASVQLHIAEEERDTILMAPLMDARRMEVYFAVYSYMAAEVLVPATSAVLSPDFLNGYLQRHRVVFSGSGVAKWQPLCSHPNALFVPDGAIQPAFTTLAWEAMKARKFANLAYAEPFYAKDFYTTAKPVL